MIIEKNGKITVEIPNEKGDLPYLLFYQSLNGHPNFENIHSLEEAQVRIIYLEALGRKPILYLKVHGGI